MLSGSSRRATTVFDPGTLTARMKEEVRTLGFSAVGVADATAPGDEGARLEEWLARGYASGMRWMARRQAERCDPSRVLEGVRSIIVVSANYAHPPAWAKDGPKISRYAEGLDYHDVLGARLQLLTAWLDGQAPGSRSRWYVDTGPVMEKAWAARAGLGWIGKHTTLISPRHGSWVFLGVVLTTIPLVPDGPATDHCGTCTRCIDACPTGAIVEPYVLDAGRCIAYLTIEHRGAFPPEAEERGLDGWIFGCDVCQEVCPWNEKLASPSGEPAFVPREGAPLPDAEELLGLDAEGFARRFAGTPVLRTGVDGMHRNCRAFLARRDGPDPGEPDRASHQH